MTDDFFDLNVNKHVHKPSHLDVESPLFTGRPHIWIQWKGTNVCCDIRCTCGDGGHFDGDFFYFFRCPNCGKVWEVGTHVAIYEVTDDRAKHSLVQEIEE